MVDASVRTKPKLRGVFHEAAFYAAVAASIPIVAGAEAGRARAAALVFVCSLAGCFGASALYHRPTWTPRTRAWLARVDHAGVYVLVAGSYTPFALLVFSSAWAVPVLAIVWSGAVTATAVKVCWFDLPTRVSAAIGIGLGWVGIAALPQLLKLPVAGVVLVVVGGVFYTAGAVVYARRRPDPVPSIFGYHELFHVLTVVGAACQAASIAFFVLPLAA